MHIIGKEKSHLLFNFQVPTIANKTCKTVCVRPCQLLDYHFLQLERKNENQF